MILELSELGKVVMKTFLNHRYTSRHSTLRGTYFWYVYFSVIVIAVLLFNGFYSTDVNNSLIKAVSVSSSKRQVLASFTNASPDLPSVEQVFKLVNEKREIAKLKPLIRNATLTKLAEERANDMSENNYYAHKNLKGQYFYDTLEEMKYQVGFACENLELSFSKSPTVYVAEWMNSAMGHRECILDNKITDAGYALVPFMPSDKNQDVSGYLVVAVHAEIN